VAAPKNPTQPTSIRSHGDFEIIFKAHYSSLCSYANQYLKDLDASEEVVQEVMLRIWMNRESLRIETSLRSYLFRSVRNGCLNMLKHEEIKNEHRILTEKKQGDTTPSGEEFLIASELQQRIRKSIEDLPFERRKIFIMSRYEGLTYHQIAERLRISIKTVENQMGKALKTLKEELSEYLPWIFLLLFNQNFFK
jgi:RNA polymerase sigma-70 factor, ECF subfamily